MKKKNPAAEAVVEEIATAEVAVSKKKKGQGSARDLHSLFFAAGLILGVISILFALIAKNGINGSGYFSIKPFDSMKKPISLTFLTSSLSSWIAGILAVVSVGCGVTRNILKRQNSLMGYLIGLVALILAALAILAVRYP